MNWRKDSSSSATRILCGMSIPPSVLEIRLSISLSHVTAQGNYQGPPNEVTEKPCGARTDRPGTKVAGWVCPDGQLIHLIEIVRFVRCFMHPLASFGWRPEVKWLSGLRLAPVFLLPQCGYVLNKVIRSLLDR